MAFRHLNHLRASNTIRLLTRKATNPALRISIKADTILKETDTALHSHTMITDRPIKTSISTVQDSSQAINKATTTDLSISNRARHRRLGLEDQEAHLLLPLGTGDTDRLLQAKDIRLVLQVVGGTSHPDGSANNIGAGGRFLGEAEDTQEVFVGLEGKWWQSIFVVVMTRPTLYEN